MADTINTSEKLDFEKVWLMFQETDRKFQETDKKFQDTDKKFKDTDKKLNKLEHLFTSQWGKLIESLVEGDLVHLLNNRGIPVNITTTRTKVYFNDRQYEFDIIAENGEEVVVVEVKTTLKQEDIKEFIEELGEIKKVLPKYANNKIYGAVAFLNEDSGCSKLAEKNGLFTIKATGNSASITNSKKFKPKVF
ncbi:MAG: hypothetical protein N2319_00855 [Candidatus Kapabacteria bacterium]|nr:hypothetical protein [Candidatus Kapabacteria bacterium]